MSTNPYYLGLPAWGHAGWKNRYFTEQPSLLASYASVFNCVEGNTTFYSIPEASSISRWKNDVQGSEFKFCFKIPREITHEPQPNWQSLKQFVHRVAPLGSHLGPFLLQFPAHYSPQHLPLMRQILTRLPKEFRYVIEVRHLAFFKNPERLEPLINEFNLGRVIYDSRPLFSGDLHHPEVLQAKHKKPDLPIFKQVYNDLTMIRLILHPASLTNQRYLEEWQQFMSQHIGPSRQIFMMIHCANNDHSPLFAQEFHQSLMNLPNLAKSIKPFPNWPVPQQGSLL